MLSVILCTYNRERYLYNVLHSVAAGTLPPSEYEIVLVDNNSDDGTVGECERFKADHPQVTLRYFMERNQGLSYARNRGIREAQGDVLVYVDDDALVNPEYLQTYAEFFGRNKEAVAAGGPIIPQYDGCEEPAWMSHYTRLLITGKTNVSSPARCSPAAATPPTARACSTPWGCSTPSWAARATA